MDKVNFPNTKINWPKMDKKNSTDKKTSETFNLLENYRGIISPYIFTNIVISYKSDDERFILSRMQQILSGTLLRSLYVRNGIADAINSRNMVSLFSNLKSFIEVPALLFYFYSVLNENLPNDKLLDKLLNIVFGNKGDGQLRVGTRESVNILSMFEKMDKYIKKLSKKLGGDKKNKDLSTVMTDFYGIVCNASHPNYDAHDIIGIFDSEEGLWRGLEPKEFKKSMITDAPRYTAPLHMTIVMTELACQLISGHKKIDNFKKLKSLNYFS